MSSASNHSRMLQELKNENRNEFACVDFTDKEIPLTSQECRWLIDLIRADIADWQTMLTRPVDEIGLLFYKLADTRITSMKALAEKFEEIYL